MPMDPNDRMALAVRCHAAIVGDLGGGFRHFRQEADRLHAAGELTADAHAALTRHLVVVTQAANLLAPLAERVMALLLCFQTIQ